MSTPSASKPVGERRGERARPPALAAAPPAARPSATRQRLGRRAPEHPAVGAAPTAPARRAPPAAIHAVGVTGHDRPVHPAARQRRRRAAASHSAGGGRVRRRGSARRGGSTPGVSSSPGLAADRHPDHTVGVLGSPLAETSSSARRVSASTSADSTGASSSAGDAGVVQLEHQRRQPRRPPRTARRGCGPGRSPAARRTTIAAGRRTGRRPRARRSAGPARTRPARGGCPRSSIS